MALAFLAGGAKAESFHLTDDKTVSGEMTSPDDTGVIFKLDDGSYSPRVPWDKFSQDDLKQLEQNPKFAKYVEALILPSQEDKLQRTEVNIKTDYKKLVRPATKQSLFSAMCSSSMGLFLLVMMYAANVYGGYEVAIFRARPPILVCLVSAVLPIIGPVIFLAMPPNLKKKSDDWTTQEEQLPAEILAESAAPAPGLPAETASQEGSPEQQQTASRKTTTGNLPGAKTFARGQFTFNRRFFETQLPGFFAVTRPDADKDKVLLVKSTRGNYEAKRIPRITQTDVNLQIQKGAASEEVTVPFVEIQEIQIRQKAP